MAFVSTCPQWWGKKLTQLLFFGKVGRAERGCADWRTGSHGHQGPAEAHGPVVRVKQFGRLQAQLCPCFVLTLYAQCLSIYAPKTLSRRVRTFFLFGLRNWGYFWHISTWYTLENALSEGLLRVKLSPYRSGNWWVWHGDVSCVLGTILPCVNQPEGHRYVTDIRVTAEKTQCLPWKGGCLSGVTRYWPSLPSW